MDSTLTQHYLNHLPIEIREALMELDSDQKWAVYIALTLEGQKYFNEVKNQFNANANTIDPILKSLVAGGLVTNKVKQLADTGNKGRSYYKTTKLGLSLLDALYEVALPPTSMRIRVAHESENVIMKNTFVSVDAPIFRDTHDINANIGVSFGQTDDRHEKRVHAQPKEMTATV
ncbi:MAG: hypothetical protein WCJ49_08265 [Deltaproteobacteria bacterium]